MPLLLPPALAIHRVSVPVVDTNRLVHSCSRHVDRLHRSNGNVNSKVLAFRKFGGLDGDFSVRKDQMNGATQVEPLRVNRNRTLLGVEPDRASLGDGLSVECAATVAEPSCQKT